VDTRDTIEIAALLAARADVVVESPAPLDGEAIRQSWHRSRERVHGWLLRLRDAAESTAATAVDDVFAIARELLLSDVAARIWSAILAARSRRTGDLDLEAIARHVLLGRLRGRRIVLEWLLDDPRTRTPSADAQLAALDRLRRRTERWTDLLLATLVRRFDLAEFGFDPERLRDFAASATATSRSDGWPLLLTGLRVAFEDVPPVDDAAAVENDRDVQSILACLPQDAFEPDGPFRTLRSVRLRRNDPLPGGPGPAPLPRSFPPRRFERDHIADG
jgi:hypothetical protein